MNTELDEFFGEFLAIAKVDIERQRIHAIRDGIKSRSPRTYTIMLMLESMGAKGVVAKAISGLKPGKISARKCAKLNMALSKELKTREKSFLAWADSGQLNENDLLLLAADINYKAPLIENKK